MFRATCFTAAFLISGTAALAGNLDRTNTSEPAVLPPVIPTTMTQDWTGVYVGLSAGVGGFNERYINGLPTVVDRDYDAFGIHAGYLRDFGSYVLGGELEYESGEAFAIPDIQSLRLKGIAGYDMGAFMPYVTVGAVNLSFETFEVFEDTTSFVGIGGTYAVTDNIRIGAEYLVHSPSRFVDAFDEELDVLNLRASFSF